MKVKEILNCNGAIKAIINETTEINSLVKFRLLGMCKQFEPVVNNFETIRDEKISQYGTANKDGELGIFPPQRDDYQSDDDYNKAVTDHNQTVENFKKDLTEILESDTDIVINKIKYSDIMEANIPTDYLIAIYDLIEE